MSHRKNAIIALASCMIGAAHSAADELDPFAMRTHELRAEVSYYTLTHGSSLEFDPASAYSECVHAQIGDNYEAAIAASDECSSTEEDVDVIRFDWCNLSMHSSLLDMSAVGVATSRFSLVEDGSITLDSITNHSELSATADWSLTLLDGDRNLVGMLDGSTEGYDLLKDTIYEVVFSIEGSDTLTRDGAMVSWNLAIAYAAGGGAAVPGAGGIGSLVLLAGRRRRRKG